jgi:hypothetical protein
MNEREKLAVAVTVMREHAPPEISYWFADGVSALTCTSLEKAFIHMPAISFNCSRALRRYTSSSASF